ncbi:transcriptional regulator [Paraburkholderia aromaticivorans]|uniref:Transcriptional regulator n=1 Tax=Paraburkholderia aromaticivorans TaxID=2026199 RepID=A0A248VF09_9BURK|nr:transcriptional regulator [Paraburkholderia aromaticivorans]ASV97627.1 transcriptional regulator [Paraburkholderia aromaticivorans]
MTTKQLKAAFAERLSRSMKRRNISNGAELCRRFNLLHPGAEVTDQAIYKWLDGKTMPRPDNLRTLAKLLEVDKHWLAYGLSEGTKAKPLAPGENYPLSAETIEWVPKMGALILTINLEDRAGFQEVTVRVASQKGEES